MAVFVKTRDIVNSDLWKLFPAINVDKTKDIPCDYPGVIGVPITYFDKHNPKQFEIVGMLRPVINGKYLYRRVLIRNLNPELPEVVDLQELLEKSGSEYCVSAETVTLPEDKV